MSEVMYDHSSPIIVSILFILLLVGVEIGYRVGRSLGHSTNESSKTQINAIQASMLGILALLIGFTFSLALQRFDSRSEAVVREANAIGTAALRAELLPATVRSEARMLLREYLGLRIRAGQLSLDRSAERQTLLAQSNRTFDALWQLALRAAAEQPNPVTTGLFVQSLNEMIDAYGLRVAALDRHVPEVVLFLLFLTFVMTACMVGYSSGLAGHRASYETYILIGLIIALVFIIIDLDRPRRGLIEVSQQSFLELQASLQAAQSRD